MKEGEIKYFALKLDHIIRLPFDFMNIQTFIFLIYLFTHKEGQVTPVTV